MSQTTSDLHSLISLLYIYNSFLRVYVVVNQVISTITAKVFIASNFNIGLLTTGVNFKNRCSFLAFMTRKKVYLGSESSFSLRRRLIFRSILYTFEVSVLARRATMRSSVVMFSKAPNATRLRCITDGL